jgi:hypothetical protein
MNAIVQNFHFEPGTLISYDGFQVVVQARVANGYSVYNRFGTSAKDRAGLVISDELITSILSRPDVEIDKNFLDTEIQQARLAVKVERGFSDLTPGEQREAQLKEAYCLATKAILGDGYAKLTLIEKNFPEIKARARNYQVRLKFTVPGPHANLCMTRDWGTKSVHNFCNAYFRLKKPDPFVLRSRHTDKGNYTSRMSHEASQLLDEICHEYCSTAQPKKASIVRSVTRCFTAENIRRRETQSGKLLDLPHPNTIYARINGISKRRACIGREGFQAAQKNFSPTQHGVRALMPGEIIEIDFWKGDVFTFTEKSNFWGLLSPDLQVKLSEKAAVKKIK